MGAGELVFFEAPTSTDAKDSDLSPNPHSGGDAYTIVVQKGTHLPQQICLLGHTVLSYILWKLLVPSKILPKNISSLIDHD